MRRTLKALAPQAESPLRVGQSEGVHAAQGDTPGYLYGVSKDIADHLSGQPRSERPQAPGIDRATGAGGTIALTPERSLRFRSRAYLYG